MSLALRLLLIVGAVITCTFVLRKMRRSQMLMSDSIFWIVMSLLLVVISIFPGIASTVSVWLGVESPSNFVFLTMIFILLVKLFSLSAEVSQLKTKLRTMVQEYATRSTAKENGTLSNEENAWRSTAKENGSLPNEENAWRSTAKENGSLLNEETVSVAAADKMNAADGNEQT